jgi:hypothetical protein
VHTCATIVSTPDSANKRKSARDALARRPRSMSTGPRVNAK